MFANDIKIQFPDGSFTVVDLIFDPPRFRLDPDRPVHHTFSQTSQYTWPIGKGKCEQRQRFTLHLFEWFRCHKLGVFFGIHCCAPLGTEHHEHIHKLITYAVLLISLFPGSVSITQCLLRSLILLLPRTSITTEQLRYIP